MARKATPPRVFPPGIVTVARKATPPRISPNIQPRKAGPYQRSKQSVNGFATPPNNVLAFLNNKSPNSLNCSITFGSMAKACWPRRHPPASPPASMGVLSGPGTLLSHIQTGGLPRGGAYRALPGAWYPHHSSRQPRSASVLGWRIFPLGMPNTTTGSWAPCSFKRFRLFSILRRFLVDPVTCFPDSSTGGSSPGYCVSFGVGNAHWPSVAASWCCPCSPWVERWGSSWGAGYVGSCPWLPWEVLWSSPQRARDANTSSVVIKNALPGRQVQKFSAPDHRERLLAAHSDRTRDR